MVLAAQMRADVQEIVPGTGLESAAVDDAANPDNNAMPVDFEVVDRNDLP
jgi:hypothetical protein